MARSPDDRSYDQDGRREEPRWGDDRLRRDAARPRGPRRPASGEWDARAAERMRRAQADFDYGTGGEPPGEWDERLGGYRYTRRDYPEERYAARSGQRRDYGPRGGAAPREDYVDRDGGYLRRGSGYAGGERYRPQWGEETTGRGYTGEMGRDYADAGLEPQRRSEQVLRQDPRFEEGAGPSDHERTGHRGRGPSGYRRSDERIREDVNDALTDDPYLDATHIRVQVQDGEVTLDGAVDTRYAKRRAERVVEDITGVRHVQNNLRIGDAAQGATEPSQTEAANQTAAMKSEVGKASS